MVMAEDWLYWRAGWLASSRRGAHTAGTSDWQVATLVATATGDDGHQIPAQPQRGESAIILPKVQCNALKMSLFCAVCRHFEISLGKCHFVPWRAAAVFHVLLSSTKHTLGLLTMHRAGGHHRLLP